MGPKCQRCVVFTFSRPKESICVGHYASTSLSGQPTECYIIQVTDTGAIGLTGGDRNAKAVEGCALIPLDICIFLVSVEVKRLSLVETNCAKQ